MRTSSTGWARPDGSGSCDVGAVGLTWSRTDDVAHPLRPMTQELGEPEMFDTPLTVIGNIVNDPVRRRVGDQEVIRFRLASNSRRRTAAGTWEHGNSLYITVNCWGRLVTGVGAALAKGAAVVAVGFVYTSEYEDREGIRRSSLEMRASSVGPDLARCIVRIESPRVTMGSGSDPAAVGSTAADGSADGADDTGVGDSVEGGELDSTQVSTADVSTADVSTVRGAGAEERPVST